MFYKVIRGNLICENKTYESFGIAAYNADNLSQPVKVIKDVFLHEESALRLAELCNELELDIVHIDDVIEDAIASCL